MLAAGSYIEDEFGVSESEARDMLIEWIERLDPRNPPRHPVEMIADLKLRKVKLANDPHWSHTRGSGSSG